MATYTTREAARRLAIHLVTLHRYILDGKVPAPKVQIAGGVKFRVWSDRDIERVQELLPKIANGRKTRHQKKQLAIGNQQSVKPKSKKNPQPRAAAVQKNKSKP